jgi:hypothetical protein
VGRSSFIAIYTAILGVTAIVQLLLGANTILLASIVMVTALGLYPITRRRLMATDILFFVTSLYYGAATLVIKTMLGQPLDQNLLAPTIAGTYLLIGFLSLTVGYVAANAIFPQAHWARRFSHEFDSRNFCGKVAIPVFLIGAVLSILHNLLRSQVLNGTVEAGGFGGFGSFYFLLPFAWACQARLALGPGATRRDMIVLFAMGGLSLFLALFANVKVIIIQFFMVLILSFVAFGIRIRLRNIAMGAVAAAFLILYVQPVIQITRSNAAGRGPVARLMDGVSVLQDSNFDPGELADQADTIARGFKYSYLGSYVYPSTWNVDRFAMILPVDEVSREMGSAGPMGGADIIREIIESTVPSALVHKTGAVTADTIGWHFGFTRNGSISRPVVGLVASSLAAYGFIGLVLLPGLVTFFSFGAINAFGTYLRGSAWTIFVLMSFLPFVEKEIAPIIALFTHQVPLQAVVVGLIYFVASAFGRKRRVSVRRIPRAA